MLKLTQVPKLLRYEKRKANDPESWQKPGTQRAINTAGWPTNNSQSSCSAVPSKTRRAITVTQCCCDKALTWRTINCWRHGLCCPIALCCWQQSLLHGLPMMTLFPIAANYLCWVPHKSIWNLKTKQNKDEPTKNRQKYYLLVFLLISPWANVSKGKSGTQKCRKAKWRLEHRYAKVP